MNVTAMSTSRSRASPRSEGAPLIDQLLLRCHGRPHARALWAKLDPTFEMRSAMKSCGLGADSVVVALDEVSNEVLWVWG